MSFSGGKGGKDIVENCLPACTKCNRLRWHRKGEQVRGLLLLGLVAKDEVAKKSRVGQKLVELKEMRLQNNQKRRKKTSASNAQGS